MKSRVFGVALAGLLAIGLAGCSAPATKASPSPTPPFASADAAYKAAEATYRGYVDAGNHIDLADEKTFEPVYAWLLGDALDHQRAELGSMASAHLVMRARDVVTLARPVDSRDAAWGDVSLAVCLDVSKTSVVDASGASVVGPDRPTEQSLRVEFSQDAASTTGLKINSVTARDGSPKCKA